MPKITVDEAVKNINDILDQVAATRGTHRILEESLNLLAVKARENEKGNDKKTS